MSKVSIRIFNDKEVRAAWDETNSKWWFNVVDIVAVLNEEDDYIKAGNYWRWLKRKLIKEGNQFVSATHRLKLAAREHSDVSIQNFTLRKILCLHPASRSGMHLSVEKYGKKPSCIPVRDASLGRRASLDRETHP